MYKIQKVKINNFWYRLDAECEFNEDVNIIIGRNGTGKTTFMNILYSVLSVDVNSLFDDEFKNVTITLVNGKNKKTIKAQKTYSDNDTFQTIEYWISGKKYPVETLANDNRRSTINLRKMVFERSSEVRDILNSLVSLSSISVYRMRSGEYFEVFEKGGRRMISPVDYRLSQLKSALTHYQLELTQSARDISDVLQKAVLSSLLYSGSKNNSIDIPRDFDKKKEQSKLVSAYKRLGVLDAEVNKKINYHISSIDKAISYLYKNGKETDFDFAAIDASTRTQRIVDLSLDAEEKTKEVFKPITTFIETLKEFIPDKSFYIDSGDFIVTNSQGDEIKIEKLSSGEKQLLILLIETLLQRRKTFVYLTDEPELSLHIEWQRKVIPAIKSLNPSSQIIAATHSPEVAAKYRSSIIDMKGVIHV